MAVIVIQGKNIDKAIKYLEETGKSIEAFDKPMRQAGQMGLAAVKSYPLLGNWPAAHVTSSPRRPGSRYKRTFALQKSWNGRLNKKNRNWAEYLIYQKGVLNPVSGKDARKYMPFVQGSEQVATHATWWNTLDDWRFILPQYVIGIFNKWSKNLIRRGF